MRRTSAEVRLLERLIPSENGLTVFDAERQETSYGICFLDGVPHIFDTHRAHGRYVATIELLTEVVDSVRVSAAQVRRFCGDARTRGLLPIPYSGCFFKGNLHIYSFSGPVRGFDLAAIGTTVPQAERRLLERTVALQSRVPRPIARAQRELLQGHRRARHASDLTVLVRRLQSGTSPKIQGGGERRSL